MNSDQKKIFLEEDEEILYKAEENRQFVPLLIKIPTYGLIILLFQEIVLNGFYSALRVLIITLVASILYFPVWLYIQRNKENYYITNKNLLKSCRKKLTKIPLNEIKHIFIFCYIKDIPELVIKSSKNAEMKIPFHFKIYELKSKIESIIGKDN